MSPVCVVLEGGLKCVATVSVGVLVSCRKMMLCKPARKRFQDGELRAGRLQILDDRGRMIERLQCADEVLL